MQFNPNIVFFLNISYETNFLNYAVHAKSAVKVNKKLLTAIKPIRLFIICFTDSGYDGQYLQK